MAQGLCVWMEHIHGHDGAPGTEGAIHADTRCAPSVISSLFSPRSLESSLLHAAQQSVLCTITMCNWVLFKVMKRRSTQRGLYSNL